MYKRATRLAGKLFSDSPLRLATFRLFYFGSVGVALGYTMQATVAAWLMATLTPSALMVALVQTASTAPSLLLGLAAGALADIVDKRRVILITQILLIAATTALGALTLAGLTGPLVLLALTFLIGASFTFYMPAQQSSVNDLVARTELPRAVALNAVAFNVARAVGPAIAGLVAAWLSTGSAMLLSGLFFLVMIVAIRRMKRSGPALRGVPETIRSGIQSGLRYTRHSPPMRALLIRNLCFSLSASALWALLPVIARDQLHLGAGGYGLLSAGFGIGAVAGALSIPQLLQRTSLNTVVTGGAILWTVASLIVAAAEHTALALVGVCAAGAAWVSVLASLSAGTQSAAPAWVRARAVAMSLVVMQAALAVGSVVWGSIATVAGTPAALATSSGLLLVLLALNRRVRVRLGNDADVTPGVQLPDLAIKVEPLPDDGPVLIQIEYRIDPENRDAFLRSIHKIEATRRRNGASAWRVFRDLGEDGRFVERFVISSWAEYVRLRTRMTIADRHLQDRVEQFQRKGVPLGVSRLIGITEHDMPPGTTTEQVA
ncbi:MAG: MFS transporter [Betaproteobacteria bacterium]